MGGSIYFEKDRGRWVVAWRMGGKSIKIRRYKRQFMACTHYIRKPDGSQEPNKRKCQGYAMACKLKSLIQARWEQFQEGKCDFRIEEFTGENWIDVIEFYRQWLREAIEPHRKPSTIHCYQSYFDNWIRPFFEQNPMRMHEIRLDNLNALLASIKLAPKGKLNVLMAMHSMMDYAWRCGRIPAVPPFPKKEQYKIVRSIPQWLTQEEHDAVIGQIADQERPIFMWLYYHYRRPGEACALYKTDYDQINDAFWIRRTLSHRQIVESTKTYHEHYVPCDPDFTSIARRLAAADDGSPFMFTNSRARRKSGRYTLEALRNVWYAACDAAGVRRIWVYRGLKHTSCTHFIESGGTIDELQMLTGHARRDSLSHYAEVTLSRKRMLMERNKQRRTARR